MAQLWLPSSAQDEINQDRAEIAAEYAEVRGTLDHFTRELRKIDPRLKMVKAHDRVRPGSPLKPGYYHVLLESPGHPTTIMPVEYDNGAYREPDSAVFEMVERNDLWNDRAQRANRERRRKLKEAAERQRARESRERVDHFNERWASANRTSILVTKNVK